MPTPTQPLFARRPRPGKNTPPHHSLHVTFSRKTDFLAQCQQPVLRLFRFVMLRRKQMSIRIIFRTQDYLLRTRSPWEYPGHTPLSSST
jgi:hypothetical protein